MHALKEIGGRPMLEGLCSGSFWSDDWVTGGRSKQGEDQNRTR